MANPRPSFKIPKGTVLNPNGRPKRDWTVAGLIEQAMEAEDETGVPYKKAVYDKLVSLAKKGDVMAIKEVNNRLDGMPKQNTTSVIIPVEEDKTKPPEERLQDVLQRIKELQES